MSIQRRFLLALALLLLASVVVLTLAVLTYTAPRVVAWERGQARSEVQRVNEALEREAEHLGIYAREWAVWDDSYRFLLAPYPEHVQANLGMASFVAANVALLAYVRDDGTIVWAGLRNGDVVDERAGMALAEELRPRALASVRHRHELAGMLPTSAGVMVVAVHPVRDSMERQPIRGAMVAARLVDGAFLERLRRQTELDLDLVLPADVPALTSEAPAALQFPADGSPRVRVLSPDRLELLSLLPDLAGRMSLVLRIELSRQVFMQGRQLLSYTLLGTVALFLLTVAAAGFMLRRMVFLPIADLAQHAFELRHSGDYSRRLDNTRNDEIGRLAQEFDALLDQIDRQAQELTKLSFEDALTGLRNRRSFDDQLRSAWALLQRTNQPLSLLVLDVDDFKRYNDHYGHPQGDEALRAVAQAMRHVLRRSGDTLARYGGEEFAAIMPGTTRTDALALAERLRQAVADLGLPHAASRVAGVLTVTVGVASVTAHPGMSEEVVLRMADEALYSAKRGGKNRVHVAAEPQATPGVTRQTA